MNSWHCACFVVNCIFAGPAYGEKLYFESKLEVFFPAQGLEGVLSSLPLFPPEPDWGGALIARDQCELTNQENKDDRMWMLK